MKRYLILIVFVLLGAILFQGFQCASPEMTTAKLAIREKSWEKAAEYCGKELAKNPKNAEATLLIAQAKMELNMLKEAAEYINKAEKMTLTPMQQQQVQPIKFEIWRRAYNDGISNYNQYYSENKKEIMLEAIDFFNIALLVRPENGSMYRFIGRGYEELGDVEKSEEAYLAYTKKLKNDIDFSKSSKVFYLMPRKDIISKFGKPVKSEGFTQGEDSLLTDVFKAFGYDIFIFYTQNDKGDFIVEGWRINPPAYWLPNERSQFTTINIGPFAYLADIYFKKAEQSRDNPELDSAVKVKLINENLDKAKEFTKIITTLDPSNIEANRFLVQIFEAQGQSDEALNEIAKLVQSDPKNQFYLAQYGEIFLRLQKYDEAIEQYKKALAIDPDMCDVLRNIAAAYKNKAVMIIQQQDDKGDKDKNYVKNTADYSPFLIESAKYFDNCRKCEKYKNDLQVLSELANLYIALQDIAQTPDAKNDYKNKLLSTTDDLQRLEQTIPDDMKEIYWLKMCKILSDMNSPKSSKACSEAQKYMK